MRKFVIALAALTSLGASAGDSIHSRELKPIEVLGVKQMADGGVAVEAVTKISGAEARRLGIEAPKDISLVAPNFYMPDYGSRMTSSIYVRGLGARIDQPVVGLTIDNIPYLNKDSYDFDVCDIAEIEVLRGAQSVLNGRNTMGGQINVRTLSPLSASGWRAMAEYGTANTVKASASYYGKFNEALGMSLAAQFKHTDGYYRNEYDNSLTGRENSGSLRWKTAWQPHRRLSISNTAVASFGRQAGYPYQLLSTGNIDYNDTCAYRRTSIADALTVAWAGKRVIVTSVTSLQYLNDCMNLDQDFTSLDYFTLEQSRREWAFTEDLFTRGSRGIYSWLGGVYAFYKSTDMQAPVTFKDTGIERLIEAHRNDCMNLDQDFTSLDYFTLEQSRREWAFTEDLFTRGSRGIYSWLGGVYAFYKSTDMQAPVTFKDTGIERLIEAHRNAINPDYPIRWDERRFVLGSDFDLRSGGFALYHESAVSIDDWRLEAGLRLDIEKTSLSYHSFTNTGFTTLHRVPDGSTEVYSHTPVDIDDHGDISHTYIELLPKFTISHSGDFEPYFSFSKGYKAGGYNTQMFSDVLQQRVMSIMGLSELYSFDEVVSYKPEWSLNYELGAHWRLPAARLKLDAALFYIDCRNQQLTVFPPGTTTGRMMTNAGRTRSMGAELSASWHANDDLTVRASYGYTDATFRRYNDGRNDYRGKRVPYAPANTLFAEVNWRISPLTFSGITPSVTATARGLGKIYWNEANTVSQPFYCLPSLSIAFDADKWSLRLSADNITATRYNTFYFVSMGNAFTQRGLPRLLSATFRVRI